MTTKIRFLLMPLAFMALATALLVACGGDDNDSQSSSSATSVSSATASPTTAPATATTAPQAAATSTVPPPANTPVPPPPPANTPVPPPPAPTTAPPAAAPPAAATLAVTIADFSFSPSSLSVRVGQPVTVNLRNAGTATHTFSIQNGASTGNIAGGSTATLQFTAPAQSGGIAFRCMIHASMTGAIMVTN